MPSPISLNKNGECFFVMFLSWNLKEDLQKKLTVESKKWIDDFNKNLESCGKNYCYKIPGERTKNGEPVSFRFYETDLEFRDNTYKNSSSIACDIIQ